MGSSLELKRLLSPKVHEKLKARYAKKDWEVVAMTSSYLVLRIERTNVRFNRDTGAVQEEFTLPPKKPHLHR